MVSMSKPQTAEQAEGYLEKENYYQKNSEMGYFRGSGLRHLGLQENTPVTPEMYKALLNGFHPKTGEKLQRNSGKEDRRAGFDVTFSAPKSVSVLMEALDIRGDFDAANKLRNAHEEAVKTSMDKIDKKYGKARIYDEHGKRVKRKSQILYGTFQHDTTREIDGSIDPQLHSHNFIFSTSFYTDPETGETKCLALDNKEIYSQKMYLGQSYRNEMARNLNELGYETEVTDTLNGFYDLKGFSKEQLDEFSGRSKTIEAHMEEYKKKYPKMAESKLKELIAQELKSGKKVIDRDEVRKENDPRLKEVGITNELIDKIQSQNFIREEPSISVKEDHIKKVLNTIIDKESIFTIEEFMRESLKYGLKSTVTEIDYMELLTKDDEVMKLDDNVYSTRTMVLDEMSIIDGIIVGKGSQIPCVAEQERAKVDSFIAEDYSNMTDGQKEMTNHILTSTDQFVAVQGDAGSGKTYSAKAIREFLVKNNPGMDVEGIVFTGKATAGLQADSGIKSKTIHSFLYREEKLKEPRQPKLLIVDESGMVGSKQVAELIRIARKNNDKIVFVGDTKQFKSISAGRAFADMQKYGISTVYMEEVMRQETAHAKESVELLKNQEIQKALELLDERGEYHEKDTEEAVQSISDKFTSLSKKKQRDMLVIASKNKDRNALNVAIRTKLGYGGDEFTIRENINLQGIARHYNDRYEKGVFIAIQGKMPGFQKGQVLEVVGKGSDSSLIRVKPQGGEKDSVRELSVFNHGDILQVYKDDVERTFQKGDLIIFTKNTTLNNKTRQEVKNGDRAYIKSIDKEGNVVTENGKKFNINDMPYLDHGYAITDVKSQGATTKHVAIMGDSQMANYNSFYTQLTRAKWDITLYTDNKEQLLANVEKVLEERSTLRYTLNKDGTRKEIGVQKDGRDEEIFRRNERGAETTAPRNESEVSRDRKEPQTVAIKDDGNREDSARNTDGREERDRGSVDGRTQDLTVDDRRQWRRKSGIRSLASGNSKIRSIVADIRKIAERVERLIEDVKAKRVAKKVAASAIEQQKKATPKTKPITDVKSQGTTIKPAIPTKDPQKKPESMIKSVLDGSLAQSTQDNPTSKQHQR